MALPSTELHMQQTGLLIGIALLCFAWLASGCATDPYWPDAKTLPYTISVTPYPNTNTEAERAHADLDGDGRDEYVEHPRWTDRDPSSRSWIVLYAYGGRTIEQVNFAGQSKQPFFHDLTGNGRLEILVPVTHNDTLSVHVIDASGDRLYRVPIMGGSARQEPDGEIPWFADIMSLWVMDVTGDGNDELVTVASTRLARTPRGVFVHRLPGGEEVGRWLTGAYMSNALFVEDSVPPSVIYDASAVNNGANVNGQSDDASYVGRVVLPSSTNDSLYQAWSRRTGGIWTRVGAYSGRFTDSGTSDGLVIYLRTDQSRPAAGWVQRLDPRDGTVQATYRPPHRIEDMDVGDLDADGHDELVLLGSRGRVRILDGETLDVQTDRRMASTEDGEQVRLIQILPDVTGNDQPNIVMHSSTGMRLLDDRLNFLAVQPDYSFQGVVQRGTERRPGLHLNGRNRGSYAATVTPNRFYLAYRHGPWVLGLLAVGAVAGVGRWAQRHLRRARLVDAINTAALSEDNEGTFLYQPDHTLEPLNERARYRLKQWIDLDTSGASPYPVDALTECCPGIAALCTTLRAQPPESVERSVETDATGPLHATAQMLPDAAGEDGYGLIVLHRASEPNSSPAWGLMARRVAHDLKNPLTSILLTLQRLQMEYRAQAPEASSDLDVYTERIENRIARLRRMTKNFMKFVDAEEPQFTTIRLNAFLKDQEGHLAESIPPDTDLIVRYADANPSIAVDVDQMQSVLENLIANAVNAMPNGGRITVSTAVERDLLWDADTAPRDAALIEVMDTGTGLDAETRRRLFEPGFTTRDNGTGLGLAIVRKVISDHDGTIEVESEPGTGSVFCIYLPLQDPDTAA